MLEKLIGLAVICAIILLIVIFVILNYMESSEDISYDKPMFVSNETNCELTEYG